MRRLCLDPLSFVALAPPELVSLAASIGIPEVGLIVQSPADIFPTPKLVGDRVLRHETLRRMADTGVKVLNLECFNLSSEALVADFRPALAVGAELGASSATVIAQEEPDESRLIDRLADFGEVAAEYGIGINVEFFAASQSVPSLVAASRIVTRSAHPNVGIVLDMLHLIRTGGGVAELAAVAPGLIRYAQICDGPLVRPTEEWFEEAVNERGVPGEGEFPIAAILHALPHETIIGIEVPQMSADRRGIPHEARARRLLESSARIIQAVDAGKLWIRASRA
jgi:sugar phosphate isomerase/epimerase